MGRFAAEVLSAALLGMSRMRSLYLGIVASVFAAGAAMAQPTADQMTCAQAIAYFQANKVIYKRMGNGAPLPIRQGVPAGERNLHKCTGRGKSWRSYKIGTLDNPGCVPLFVCD